MKQLFFFVDGLGLAPASPDNPVNRDVCPFICDLIESSSRPIDACLGVDGLPQSATGQATLFTGRNAAQFMGRHVEGFPGPTLRKFVEQDNVFTAMKALGKKSRFADGYMAETVDELRSRRFRSVTTTAALTVPEVLSLKADILANQAVLHDITRSVIVSRGYQGPLVSPRDAAEHLIQLAMGYDYTLFEYFLTDRAGHSGSYESAAAILRQLDEFLSHVFPEAEQLGFSLALTSDHGNIESLSVKGHTRNPIPLIARGACAGPLLSKVECLTDVTPVLLEMF